MCSDMHSGCHSPVNVHFYTIIDTNIDMKTIGRTDEPSARVESRAAYDPPATLYYNTLYLDNPPKLNMVLHSMVQECKS